jgi:outer membrane lipoprotein-sorting protein
MPDSPVSLLRSGPLAVAAAFILVIVSARCILAGEAMHPVAANASAEAPPAAAPEAAEAKEALRKAVRFHREAKDLTLKFKASVYNASLDKQDQYQGKLLLKGASKFRLEIPGGTYVSDGESYWEYHAQNKQVILKSAKDMDDKPLPGEVLLRFLDSDPLSVGRAVDGGKEFLEMRLDPSRAMKNLDSLAVLLDRSDYSLHRISSRDVSGNEAEYTVTTVKRNAGIKDKEFTFAVPKGAEVVDMRGQ